MDLYLIKIFKMKIYRNLSNINNHYYLKLRIPTIFLIISRNREYIRTQCNDRNNPFHFACRKLYSYNNPQC